MPILGIDGYEHGVASTNGGGLFGNIYGGSRVSIQSTTKRSGTYALRCDADTTEGGGARTPSFTAANILVSRFALYLSSLPPERIIIWEPGVASGTTAAITITSGGVIEVVQSNYQTVIVSGPTLGTGSWHVVDIRVTASANPWTIDWRVNGQSQTQGSYAASANTFSGVWLECWGAVNSSTGALTSGSASVLFDDHSWSTTSADYPLTVDRVLHMVPTAMGTHSGEANFQDDDGTAIDSTSYQRVDDVPFPSGSTAGDHIRQVTASGTSYIEMTAGSAPDTGTAVAVSGLLAYMAAGTAANNGQTRVRRSDGTETTVFSGDMSESAHFYKRAIVSEPGSGWTQAQIEGLRWRIGYSTDVSPVPYWTSLMLEIGYPESAPPPSAVPPGSHALLGVGI